VRRLAVALGMVLATVGGCSSSSTPDPGPVFNNEDAQDVACMAHQTESPGARYTTPEMRNTGEVLALMRYYTSNGAKPYCDATPSSPADKAWAQQYVDLGGTTEKVPTVLR
jgi:hypothetical protein